MVTTKIESQWADGFVTQIEFEPNVTMSGWTIQFETDAEITNIWNAEIVSRVGNLYTVTNKDYNGTISEGGSAKFGFQAAGANTEIDFIGVADSGSSDDGYGAVDPEPIDPVDPPVDPADPDPVDDSGAGQTYFVGQIGVVSGFDPAVDKLDLGSDSIHNQIPVDTPDGLMFLHMFNPSKTTLVEGVSLADLGPLSFAPIA
ncbi:MAG: cellulose binding domain-containing protein, partial [Pseudomonadota bacterium]